jgi:hypothetical protein
MAGALEAIAYGLARGAVRAWFDEMDARKLAEREVVSEEDLERARRFRAAVERVRREQAGNPGPDSPASGGG